MANTAAVNRPDLCTFLFPYALCGFLSSVKAGIAAASPGYLQTESFFVEEQKLHLSSAQLWVWTVGHHSVFSGISSSQPPPPQECHSFSSCNMLILHPTSTMDLKKPCYLLLNPQLCKEDEKRSVWNIVTVIITSTVCSI